jgi:hypothetical protein
VARPNYRRKKGSDTWHFCENCTGWPTSDYDTRDTNPSGELCNQCLDKEDNGNCS